MRLDAARKAAVFLQARMRRFACRGVLSTRRERAAAVARASAGLVARRWRRLRRLGLRGLEAAASHRLAAVRGVAVARGAWAAVRAAALGVDEALAACGAARAIVARSEREAEWLRDYVAERAAESSSSSSSGAVRAHLGRHSSPEARARRGRWGLRCEVCGASGVVGSSCPDCRAQDVAKETKPPACKPPSEEDSSKPYAAKTHAEKTLHIVLHRAIEILGARLEEVPGFAETILRDPPDGGPVPPRDNKAVFEEDRDFLLAARSAARPRRAHEHRVGLRADGAYVFDRSFAKGEEREAELRRNYEPDPRAGRRNVHGQRGWVSVTSRHDDHSTCVELQTTTASGWGSRQKRAMTNRGLVLAHVASVVRRELVAEANREAKRVNGLSTDERQARAELARLEEARAEAADRIVRILVAHNLLTSREEAEYLVYANDAATRGDPDPPLAPDVAKPDTSSIAALLGAATLAPYYDDDDDDVVVVVENTDASKPRRRSVEKGVDDNNDLQELYRPGRRGAAAYKARQLECIVASGPGRLRTGAYEDDATIAPAVIPFQKALSSGGLSRRRRLTADERRYQALVHRSLAEAPAHETSRAAADILDRLRAPRGRRRRMIKEGYQHTVPLWSRMTDAPPGQRQYSDVLGQPMGRFHFSNKKKKRRP